MAMDTATKNNRSDNAPCSAPNAQAWNVKQQVLPPFRPTYTYNINSNDTNQVSVHQEKDQNENPKTRDINQAPDSPTCVALVPEERSLEDNEFDLLMNPVPEVEQRQPAAATATETTNSSTKKKKIRSVSFDETVSVLTIPNKDAYSDRIKKYLWTEPYEMMQNTNRNAIEFASENWDWRQVAEDVEFFVCPKTGEKIHPCHAYSLSYHYHQDSGNYSCHHQSVSTSSANSYPTISTHTHRPLKQHPFFEKSRQAAMAWQQFGG